MFLGVSVLLTSLLNPTLPPPTRQGSVWSDQYEVGNLRNRMEAVVGMPRKVSAWSVFFCE